jgi:hypothetical protein
MNTGQKENSFKDMLPKMDNSSNSPKTKFETFGEEMLEKVAKKIGIAARYIYLQVG